MSAAGFALAAIGLVLCLPVACSPDSQTPPPTLPGPPATPRDGESRQAILEVLRDPEAFARARRLSTLLPTLGPEAVPEVRRALENPAVDRGAVEIALLVRFWATHDPASAASWALARSPLGFRAAALVPAIEAWATADPRAAHAWTRSIPAGAAANSELAQVALVRGWFDSGHPGLENYTRDLGPSFERQRALAALARKTIQRDGPSTVMRWAEALPDEPKRFKLAAFR